MNPANKSSKKRRDSSDGESLGSDSDSSWNEVEELNGDDDDDDDNDADDDGQDDEGASGSGSISEDDDESEPEDAVNSDDDDPEPPLAEYERFQVKDAPLSGNVFKDAGRCTLCKTPWPIYIHEKGAGLTANTNMRDPGVAKFSHKKHVYYGKVVANKGSTIKCVLQKGEYSFKTITKAQDCARVANTMKKLGELKTKSLDDKTKALLLAASGSNPCGKAVEELRTKFPKSMKALTFPPLSHSTWESENTKKRPRPDDTVAKGSPMKKPNKVSQVNMFSKTGTVAPAPAPAPKPDGKAKAVSKQKPKPKMKPKPKAAPKVALQPPPQGAKNPKSKPDEQQLVKARANQEKHKPKIVATPKLDIESQPPKSTKKSPSVKLTLEFSGLDPETAKKIVESASLQFP